YSFNVLVVHKDKVYTNDFVIEVIEKSYPSKHIVTTLVLKSARIGTIIASCTSMVPFDYNNHAIPHFQSLHYLPEIGFFKIKHPLFPRQNLLHIKVAYLNRTGC